MADGARAVVEEFLRRACDLDLDGAAELLAEDCRYENVPFHRAIGRERIVRDLGMFMRPLDAFGVEMQNLAVDGDVVLTERIDTFRVRGHTIAIPLMGTFVVRDGQVTEWRDYFDWSLAGARAVRSAVTWPARALLGRR